MLFKSTHDGVLNFFASAYTPSIVTVALNVILTTHIGKNCVTYSYRLTATHNHVQLKKEYLTFT